MPLNKPSKVRVVGLPKNYKYKDWLNSVLNVAELTISYFNFADTFDDSERTTNYHYADLLKKLSIGQSNRSTRISTSEKRIYETRNDPKTDFGIRYKQYWEKKSSIHIKKAIQIKNNQTVMRLNELTNNKIINLAEKANGIDENPESSDSEDNTKQSDDGSAILSSTDKVILQASNLAFDEAGKLETIDL